MHDRSRAPIRIAAAAAISLSVLAGTAVGAAATEFPKGWEGYHSYTELTAEVAAVAAAHPDIVHLFSIGKSYKGRELWAVKVSDNVNVDENEPELLFDGTHHSDEHMGVEMTLHIFHWLVDGYGVVPRITNIVDTREIYIVFLVNPDGAEYDISGGKYHFWRKNRQPVPGSTAIGTDLNRNYGYKWGLGGRTSANPRAITYHGPRPFSAPETRAMRDFLASRVVDGRQQIRAAISFHELGRLVMWPYGYTLKNVPPDMTTDDHSALFRIGRHMATTNGYKPEQASDLYITRGTTKDYMYGTYRIFAYTFEMSIKDYPDDSKIAGETGRNKEAVLYLMERAGCPYAVLGAKLATARCGAFDDDLEVGRGWTVNPDGTDTAPTAGRFTRGDPQATSRSGPKQLGTTTSGRAALVTGKYAGKTPSAADLDGVSTVRSAPIDLPAGTGQRLTFRYVFAHDSRSTSADAFTAIVEAENGTQTPVMTVAGKAADLDGAWKSASILLDPWAGQTIHIRFQAVDGGPGNLVEVEVDDVRVTRPI
ncbi:MAG TPA: M14 family metallopeptidase [Patescibacteria group bacterium]|nr:M14 family metallopeptidase [Patescibacteria group bacterium]